MKSTQPTSNSIHLIKLQLKARKFITENRRDGYNGGLVKGKGIGGGCGGVEHKNGGVRLRGLL